MLCSRPKWYLPSLVGSILSVFLVIQSVASFGCVTTNLIEHRIGLPSRGLHIVFQSRLKQLNAAPPSKSGIENNDNFFFLRKALFVDMSPAAKILTDSFFADKTNFITFQLERLQTYLSLESTFPKEYEMHEMYVVCRKEDGKVLGIVEVDGRPSQAPNAAPRPYMCNLAVDPVFRKMGLASALVDACEERVKIWGGTEIFLRAKAENAAATNMYTKLGYTIESTTNVDPKTKELLVLMKKTFPIENTPQAIEHDPIEFTSHQ